jgi:hypothetical protein
MLLLGWLAERCYSLLYTTLVLVVSLRRCALWMGCILHHYCFPDLADSILVLLCWLLADLLEVYCAYFHRSLASSPQLVYFLLLLGVSGMSCNPSLHAVTLFCRQWMPSVYGMVCWACHLVTDCIPLILLAEIAYCSLSLLCCYCGTLNFCGHLLGRCSICILRLLDYGSCSYHSCKIFTADCYTCFLCRLQVTSSFCFGKRLCHPRICLLCPLILPLFLTWSIPSLRLDLLIVARSWRH